MLHDMWVFFTEMGGFMQFIVFIIIIETLSLPFRAILSWVKINNKRLLIENLAGKGYTPEDINKTILMMDGNDDD